eukprot:NODE_625_length_5289_cov_0.416956.p8 type:complete len:107 gc:universal NODE_625_length_5289_cov_0.416956:4485-4165(-)
MIEIHIIFRQWCFMSSPLNSPKKRKFSEPERNENDEPFWNLSSTRKITIREWKGKAMIDLREYYSRDDGTLAPGKKGITLSLEQYKKLKDLLEEIDAELGLENSQK